MLVRDRLGILLRWAMSLVARFTWLFWCLSWRVLRLAVGPVLWTWSGGDGHTADERAERCGGGSACKLAHRNSVLLCFVVCSVMVTVVGDGCLKVELEWTSQDGVPDCDSRPMFSLQHTLLADVIRRRSLELRGLAR